MKIHATTMGKMIRTDFSFHSFTSIDPQVDRKVVVVGDAACGKTALLQRFTKGHWVNDDYQPTLFADCSADVDVGVTTVELALWDTGSDFKLRDMAYPDKDVVLVCFNIMDPQSLVNVEKLWLPEVRHHCSGVPILLVGLQKDGAKDKEAVAALHRKGQKPVSSKQGEYVASKIGAKDYVECSAKTGKGVEEVFELTAQMSLFRK